MCHRSPIANLNFVLLFFFREKMTCNKDCSHSVAISTKYCFLWCFIVDLFVLLRDRIRSVYRFCRSYLENRQRWLAVGHEMITFVVIRDVI